MKSLPSLFSITEKNDQLNEKIRIGNFASTFIKEDMNIILDSGTTTYHIANAITGMKDIRVITNDLILLVV